MISNIIMINFIIKSLILYFLSLDDITFDEAYYWCYGSTDFLAIMDFPDHTTVTGMALNIAASGKFKGNITPLITVEEMDEAIAKLTTTLSKSNPEAMQMLKKVFWEGTEHWDSLLIERAAMSGKLVLSDFTRQAINKFKKK